MHGGAEEGGPRHAEQIVHILLLVVFPQAQPPASAVPRSLAAVALVHPGARSHFLQKFYFLVIISTGLHEGGGTFGRSFHIQDFIYKRYRKEQKRTRINKRALVC